MEEPFAFAFFDIDGTLVQGNAWTGILHYPRINRLKVAGLYLRTIPRYVLNRFYLLSQTRYRTGWISGLANLVKNWEQAEVEYLFDWLANDFLKDIYHQDVIALLEQHKAEGTRIVLISTIFEGAVIKIAQRLGADAAIGTQLDYKNHHATGHIQGRACVGRHKLDFIREYLKQNGYETNLASSIGYADSYSDAPMLAAMGKAVAVYPDEELRAAALEQGWQIHEQR